MSNNSFLRQTATTIVFIDASLSDYNTLQAGIIEGVKTVIISPDKDGIEQISQILQQHPHITTIHILSHGAPGCLYLGNSQLNLTNIHNYTQQLQQWQPQNILLYGCNVAAGDAGAEFIHKLHQITKATISASTTKTGNAALGGNWQLEVNIPVTETFHGTYLHLSDIVADTLNTYQGVFAPILVGNYNTTGIAYGVQVVGNYAYVADAHGGLKIIGVSEFTSGKQAPTNITLSTITIAENQALGTVVGNFTTTALDTGDTFTYSLVTGDGATDNSLFTITNNQLKTNFVFDFEAKNSYSIRVRTTDQGGLFFEKQLTIGVTDLNDNDSFTTTAQQDIIDADYGENTITSTFANLQQNDTIKAGNGTDTLIISGGTDNDIIYIDASNTTNQLDIPGTTVFGFERFDLSSFTGTISFDGTTGNDWIKAGTGDDILIAGDGNDYLNGGIGADLLIGGKGNDTYVVDNVGDVIAEGLNGGIDTVESSITWTLRANLENLTLQGTTAINGTGNNLNNIMTGNTGNNVLNGGLGNDTLIGGLGNDTLIGRLGNDSYYVDNAADIIKENANAGTDSVFSTAATYTLSANVENLTLQGTTAINGTGNTLNNNITGNVADNVLTGGTGADTLTGGLGNDSLYLGSDTAVDNVNYTNGDGTDTVYQFVRGVGGDKLNFTGIANFDVITSGTSTLVRVGDGISGNAGFGTGQLLVTLSGTSGFNSTNANLNLFGGTFLFS
ncbi:DUF4347 domain-containing protein [Dolichospermum circinale]|uniref:DUF4347 domain-containing protein n=1 Tax=Dolichospermum circinale TaxID=109265 RepID=UPI00232AEEFE|nr:DUF4347 domain-containing protein [Dolichospermum circinale]MDB9455172.1 DUF4347 domain-containing protein [Dolichospermum circinale CS-541/06]MDB9461987.1 DUF4347 domain-containing protein [Dolichospermum circinale CS-541/04]